MVDSRRFVRSDAGRAARRPARSHFALALAVATIALGSLAGDVRAEEVKGRWRFDVQIGSHIPGGRIDSKTGNSQVVTGFSDEIIVDDPRSDAYALDYASHRGGERIELHASYGLAAFKRSELVIDLGVGYQRSKIRNIQLSYSFDAADRSPSNAYALPGCETLLAQAPGNQLTGDQLAGCTWFSERLFALFPGTFENPTRIEQPDDIQGTALTGFVTEKIEAGELTSYPISIDALLRFRPTKRFNPYIGVGVGYLVVDFEESARFKEIADQLEGSLVAQVTGPTNSIDLRSRDLAGVNISVTDVDEDGTQEIQATELGHRMVRPRVDAPNSLFGQLRGGAEYQFARRWTVFAEGRFSWMAKDIRVTADGVEQFGSATPAFNEISANVDEEVNPLLYPVGGRPMYIFDGGLRQPAYDPITGELINQGENGQTGEYYFDGGKFKHGGWAFTVGLRVTL